MKRYLGLFASFGLAACSPSAPTPGVDLAGWQPDLAQPSGDLAGLLLDMTSGGQDLTVGSGADLIGTSMDLVGGDFTMPGGQDLSQLGDAGPLVTHLIGSPCASDSQCTRGKTPVCWKNLFGNTGYIGMPNGWCTSDCTTHADCDDYVACVDFGASYGKWCAPTCSVAADCRSDSQTYSTSNGQLTLSYACYLGDILGTFPVCFSDIYLGCDPTAGDGTCVTYESLAGGCIRWADGGGRKGYCNALCVPGTGHCAPDQSTHYGCIIRDKRYYADGTPSGDKFAGPVCTYLPDDRLTLIADGAECLYQGSHYNNICVDGDMCWLKGQAPFGTTASADNLCHQVCYLPGGTYELPDGGAPPDGGVPNAADCPNGMYCADKFNLESSASPAVRVGLCVAGAVDLGASGVDLQSPPQDLGVGDASQMGCYGFLLCYSPCLDQSCVNACYANTRGASQTIVNSLFQCIDTACPSTGGGVCDSGSGAYDRWACQACINASVSMGGTCASQYTACVNDG